MLAVGLATPGGATPDRAVLGRATLDWVFLDWAVLDGAVLTRIAVPLGPTDVRRAGNRRRVLFGPDPSANLLGGG